MDDDRDDITPAPDEPETPAPQPSGRTPLVFWVWAIVFLIFIGMTVYITIVPGN